MITIDLSTSISDLQNQLQEKNWLEPTEEIISTEKPGEGNMNVVIRTYTNERSFILKQSRPYVQKYQQIDAPIERIDVEYQFYNTLKKSAIAPHIPSILAYDKFNYVLMLQDLGQCEDMTYLYSNRNISSKILEKLAEIIGAIHQTTVPAGFSKNKKLRELNHQHIFVLPFLEDNGFELDTIQKGLQSLSLPYKKDTALKKVVDEIGAKYLSDGDTLLHGDYYPGSWMTQAENLFVIDPEFSFAGFAEFDLGVLAAHSIMSTMDVSYLNLALQYYPIGIDEKLTAQVAGIEIIRRLIGLAQLPLERTIQEKDYLLRTARKLILE